MKISVITACFRSAATLPTALESVRRQRLDGGLAVELLVVDGGSDDGTVELLRAWEPRFRESGIDFVWTSEPDRGMYDALDKGIARATGEVVGILNADDALAADDVLARIAGRFAVAEEEGRSVDCLYGTVRFVRDVSAEPADAATALDALRAAPTHRICFARFWRPWMLQWGYMPPHPGVFIRRACYLRWGGYEPSRDVYRIAADYELLVRYFRVHRMASRHMPVCTTVMRTGGLSTRDVGARRRLNEEIIRGNRANGYFCCWPMLLPKYAVKIWEFALPRLGLCGKEGGR